LRMFRRLLRGGSAGNEQLTAVIATLLLLLLAIEGATLLRIRSLLNVHAFVGMLLIPVVAAKLASTGWRLVRYYRGAEEYVLLTRAPAMVRAIRRRVPAVTATAAALSLVAGIAVATLTVPAVDQLQDNVTGQTSFDAH